MLATAIKFFRNASIYYWRRANRKFNNFNSPQLIPPQILDSGFGTSRGQPLDRNLIEKFLESNIPIIFNLPDVKSLEIGDNRYTSKYLTATSKYVSKMTKSQSCVLTANNILDGDLTIETNLSNSFDLIISTQVLAFTSNPFKVVENYVKLLKPGGILVGTEPQISHISESDRIRSGDYFRFTTQGIESIFEKFTDCGDLKCENLGGWLETFGLLIGLVEEDFESKIRNSSQSYAPIIGYTYTKDS